MEEERQTHREPREPRKKRKKRKSRIGFFIGTFFLVCLLTGAILSCFAAVYIKTVIMPEAALDVTDISMNLTSTLYYTDPATDQLVEMRTLYSDENRVWVYYDELPENLLKATVAIEDKRFHDHNGVDWIRTAKGVVNMFTGQEIQGGSTITQQLIKNMTNEDDVTVKRKIMEIFRALEFDNNYSKERTLEWYLNYIYLGENCNGVYTASYTYFGKHVSELTLAECASLISITNNPSIYSPYSPYKYTDPETGEVTTAREYNKQRQELTLRMMLEQGMISQEEHDQAVAQPLDFVRGEGESRPVSVYTWYEDKVISDVLTDLQEVYGVSYKVATDIVYSGGLKIETCFDPVAQAAVDAVYSDRANLDYMSNNGQLLQSAITIVDNTTGNVVAVAGGVGEKTESRSYSRASDAIRPPGSSIKPLAVYAPAIDMGLITPATVIDDTPYNLQNGAPWPINAYGSYRGRMTVYEAVEDSANTVAVKVISDYITPELAFEFLSSKLQFSSLVFSREIGDRVFSDVGAAQLALGGLTDGLSTYEMAAAYAAFPRGGIYSTPRTYSRVLGSDGEVLLDNTQNHEVVMAERTAWYINYMLENVVNKGTGWRADFDGMTVAGKTGTTTSRKDLWFAGYTPYYTAAIWTGYDQQEWIASSLNNPSTVLFSKVMSALHKDLPNASFAVPTGSEVVSVAYCLDCGLRATEYCSMDARGSRVVTGQFLKEDVPNQFCTCHVPVDVCLDCPILKENGEPTGQYYLAGEFCPEESIKTISVVDYERVNVSASVRVNDEKYLKGWLESQPTCTVHTGEVPQDLPFDIDDPTTWPTDDPFFNPYDESTWPTVTVPDGGGESPDDGTTPPDDGATPPDPDDGQTPDSGDTTTPPVDGTAPSNDGTAPSDDGTITPHSGEEPQP